MFAELIWIFKGSLCGIRRRDYGEEGWRQGDQGGGFAVVQAEPVLAWPNRVAAVEVEKSDGICIYFEKPAGLNNGV